MCDERTASRLSTFNSAKRNGLSAENLVHMAQLHDHWTYGLESPAYTHKATLQLPTVQTTPKSIRLPAPTLQDLLNPAYPDDEEPSFFVNDPYNAAALDADEEDEEEDDEPMVMRGSDVERLEIDELIDLANSKLIARYSDSSEKASSREPAVAARPSSTVPATPWTEDNWAAKDADF
jgi:hypothetical protein